jgi:hypothetical protein
LKPIILYHLKNLNDPKYQIICADLIKLGVLSVFRECARIQTFSDNHIFYYSNLMAGYKMVGNAVPNDPKYQIICADLIKLGVLSVFLWMQDLNGMVF